MKYIVVIVAGGKGLRMGADLPKQFVPIKGKPILMHTLESFQRWNANAELIVVLPKDHQAYWQMLCREIPCKVTHRIADGGETRFHSVRNALALVEAEHDTYPEATLVGIHDGVRPFATPEVIQDCFDKALHFKAAIPVIPMEDSLREKDEDGSSLAVDRSRFVAVQTPQVFEKKLLLEAYKQDFSPLFTDDASVVEALGHNIHCATGCKENLKITTPLDLKIATLMLGL